METAAQHGQDPWWRDSVGYEVYLRSFADSDGDGIGDLAGLQHRLDHLHRLGVNLLWVTPFYPSPMADYGYDVADYCNVNPTFGDLDLFDQLIDSAHELGIRVIADIVPNHTSSQHPWFVDAISSRDSEFRNHYIWADPAEDGGPPNNWIGYFGGPAWTLDPSSGQYYLHLFLSDQPDLNWANSAVQGNFDDILRFWFDRGIDGFRIDVAQALSKDQHLRSNPQIAPWDPEAPRWEQWDAFDHQFDVLQPKTLDIFRRWQEVAAPYDALLLGETYVLEPAQWANLIKGDGLHAGFWFGTMHVDWNAADIRATLEQPLAACADPRRIGWVAGSHDEPRPPTRFGGGDEGRHRALALATLLFGLPGIPVLYQGEELGLVDGIVGDDERADPVGADVTVSRDGCRTPMPWHPGTHMGFSNGPTTWLPLGGRTPADTASVQQADPDSWFARYRALIALRHAEPDLREAAFSWIDDLPPGVVGYLRGSLAVLANTATTAKAVATITGEVLFNSQSNAQPNALPEPTAQRNGDAGSPLMLDPSTAMVIRINGQPRQ